MGKLSHLKKAVTEAKRRVYQGSPHKYDGKLDHSKIGTGEGAQAYGYGHYLAENPDVAKGYQDRLSDGMLETPDGEVFDVSDLEHLNVRARLRKNKGDVQKTLDSLVGVADDAPVETQAMLARDIAKLEQYKASGLKSGGHLYEFDLPESAIDNMLDWDAPAKQMPPAAKAALEKANPELMAAWQDNGMWELDKFSAGTAYNAIAGNAGADSSSRAALSAALQEAGIPGIKYHDGMSRAAGEGTRNFVIFPGNEDLVKAVSRNGEKLSAAALAPLAGIGLMGTFSEDSQAGVGGAIKAAGRALDMSEAARMQRAKDMGFDADQVYYHGTNKEFRAFDPESIGANQEVDDIGFFFTSNKQTAQDYAEDASRRRTGEPRIVEAYLKNTNPLIIEVDGSKSTIAHFEGGEGPFNRGSDALMQYAIDSGYDSLIVDNGAEKLNVVFDPANIRSINAAFDPAKKDSADLLASLGGAAVLGAALAPDDAEAGVVTKAGKQIIEAYHGSPHDFDKFSMDKIGTGEGAQAYGHGLYFADQEDVARGYQRDLNRKTRQATLRGQAITDPGIKAAIETTALDDGTPQLSEAIKYAEDYLKQAPTEKAAADWINAVDTLKAMNPEEVNVRGLGATYQVDIDATPEELLDWDLPLSEQPEKVRASVDKIIKERGYNLGITDDYKDAYTQGDLTGENLYTFMGNSTSKDAASEYLNTAGIKGIRYQDGMSRGAEGGTHNYVVFDDQLITIAKKYGISTVLAGSVLAGTMTPEQAQAATGLENFTQRRAAKRDYWKQLKSTMLEGMAGVNRGLVDTLNFVGPDQVNAVLQLSGSENRIPTFSDIPGVQQATQGGYMEPGTARDIVRTGSEFLSPL